MIKALLAARAEVVAVDAKGNIWNIVCVSKKADSKNIALVFIRNIR